MVTHARKILAFVSLCVAIPLFAGALRLGLWSSPHPEPGGSTAPVVEGMDTFSTPELDFPEPVADLGANKGMISHRFSYRNRSSNRVVIESIRPACACTLVKPERMELDPGEESSFGIQVDLSKQERGFKRYLIDVFYKVHEDPRKVQLELVVMNDPDVYLTSSQVTLSGILGDSPKATVALVDYRKERIDALRIPPRGVFQARVVKTPNVYQPGWKWELEVSANTANLRSGEYRESLFLEAEPAFPQPVELNVRLLLLPRISPHPGTLLLSLEDRFPIGKGRLITLSDRRSAGISPVIASVSSPSEALDWAIVDNPNGTGQALRVGLREGAALPTQGTRMHIEVKGPCSETVLVPISFR